MAATLKPYLNCVRSTLTAALCIQNFDSQVMYFTNYDVKITRVLVKIISRWFYSK